MSIVGDIAKSYLASQAQENSAWGSGVQGFGMPASVGSVGGKGSASVEATTSYSVGGPVGSVMNASSSTLWVVLGVTGIVLLTVLVARG